MGHGIKAWTVMGIVKDGEMVCEDCLNGQDEVDAFNDTGPQDSGIGVLFASDMGDEPEVCTRCNRPLGE